MSSDLVAALYLGFLGLFVGSFLNVVIWRVPRDESVVRPPSACPACGARIRARDNLPVISWLLLRGRCRDCGASISRRYPLVEIVTAIVFAGVGLVFGVSWATPAFVYGAAIAVALALIDLDTHRLPDAIVLRSYPVVLVLLTIASWGSGDWGALLRAVTCAAILFVAYGIMWFAYPSGMGLGDVKLAAIIGAYLGWLGWGPLVVGAFAAFLLAGVFAIGLLAARRAGRKTGIPFGPWMLLGAAVGVVWGEQVWNLYLGTFM